jgi:hypothetical protein
VLRQLPMRLIEEAAPAVEPAVTSGQAAATSLANFLRSSSPKT